jgi:hypothetical protein
MPIWSFWMATLLPMRNLAKVAYTIRAGRIIYRKGVVSLGARLALLRSGREFLAARGLPQFDVGL